MPLNEATSDAKPRRHPDDRKPALPTIVRLTKDDTPWTGAICCDDLEKVYRDEVTRDYGALPPSTMAWVDDALRAALSL